MTDWIITNCESRGNAHSVCQDHTEYKKFNKVFSGALADGLSSNKYSDRGAYAVTSLACQEMCVFFECYYSGNLSSKDFVKKIQSKVYKKYSDKYDITQMKSTLLLCAIHNDKYILGHIGDGAILCFGKNNYVISPPQENEAGGTATYTILDKDAEDHFVFIKGKTDDIDGFLLTSDGLLGNVYYSGTDIPQLAYELFGSVYKDYSPSKKQERDAQFRAYLSDYIQAQDHLSDDCSLFMIARKIKTGYVDYDVSNGFEPDTKWLCHCGQSNDMDQIRCSNCRQLYVEQYPSSIIKINNKESFFSKLNLWVSENTDNDFDPGQTAEIIDIDGFKSICVSLKKTYNETNDEAEVCVEASLDNEEINLNYEKNHVNNEDQQLKSEDTYSTTDGNDHNYVMDHVTKFGKSALATLKKGIQLFNETLSEQLQESEPQIKEKTYNDEIRKIFPISLSHIQLIEAAYHLHKIPVIFLSNNTNIEVTSEQIDVVNAIFNYDTFLDVLHSNSQLSYVFHHYVVNEKVISVYNEKQLKGFVCKIWEEGNNALSDYSLLPQYVFGDEIKSEQSIHDTNYNYGNLVISWNWFEAYHESKADASDMIKKFYELMNQNNYVLDNTIANLWVVAGDHNIKELIAYLLTSRYLILLKSLDRNNIIVKQVSFNDDSAIQLKKKFLPLDNEGVG